MGKEEEPERESHLYDKKWVAQRAPSSRAQCKEGGKCEEAQLVIAKGELRIGRRFPSPFNPDEVSVNWFHARCIFNQQARAKASTQVIERGEDIDGFFDLSTADQRLINELMAGRGDHDTGRPSSGSASKSKSRSSKSKSKSKSAPTVREASGRQTSSSKSAGARGISKEEKPKKKKTEGGRRDAGRIIML